MEDMYEKKPCFVVYEDDDHEWSICLRRRNKYHPGEPVLKVWVYQYGREVARFSEDFRGYFQYEGHEELLPEFIVKKAEKEWKKLCNGEYTEKKLAALRRKFIEKYEARKEAANAALLAQIS